MAAEFEATPTGNTTGAGQVTRVFFNGSGVNEVLAIAEPNGAGTSGGYSTVWQFADQAGTVRRVGVFDQFVGSEAKWNLLHRSIDAAGNIVNFAGKQVSSLGDAMTALASTPIIYAGHQWDADLELYDAKARWYDPHTQRMLSEDPARSETNLYRYAGGDPVNKVDPDGRAATLLTGAAGAGIGGIIGGAAYWLTADDFTWGGFAASVGAGAAIGGLAGLTLGGSLLAGAGSAAGGATAIAGSMRLVGAAIGGVHGYLEGRAGGAGVLGSLGSAGLGAAIGLSAPHTAFASAAGAFAAGTGQWIGGGHFLGNAFQAGGLVGNLAGGIGAGSLRDLWRRIGPEASMMVGGAAIGGYLSGTAEGTLLGANLGMFGAGILRGVGAFGTGRGLSPLSIGVRDVVRPGLERVADLNLPFRQPLSRWVRASRFFATATRGYARLGETNLGRLVQRLPILGNLEWEQSHIFIQQRWFRAGSPTQWFPSNPFANIGLRRLGQAGWNVWPLPKGLNQSLGRHPTASFGFAGLPFGAIGGSIYGTYKLSGYLFDGD